MSTVDEKLGVALNVLNGNIDLYNDRFMKLYPFTTENIAGYINYFSLKGAKLLTVGSSADQAINASLNGCRDITVLDICPYTKEHYYLKNATIQTFSRSEYEKFLFYNKYLFSIFENFQVLNTKQFLELASALKELDMDSYEFWSELLTLKKGEKTRRNLFTRDERSSKTIRRINPYLHDDESYNATRKALQETTISFIEGDIMTTELTDTYDNIFLSNIASGYSIEEFHDLINRLTPHLSSDGKILISYLYAITSHLDYCSGEPEIYNIEKALEVFPKTTKLIRFGSVDGPFFTDGALVYQKKK